MRNGADPRGLVGVVRKDELTESGERVEGDKLGSGTLWVSWLRAPSDPWRAALRRALPNVNHLRSLVRKPRANPSGERRVL